MKQTIVLVLLISTALLTAMDKPLEPCAQQANPSERVESDTVQKKDKKIGEKNYLFTVASSFIINLTIRNTTSAMITKSIIAPTKSPTRNFIGPT